MRKKKGRAAEKKGDKKEVEGECGKLPFWEWEDLPYDTRWNRATQSILQTPKKGNKRYSEETQD